MPSWYGDPCFVPPELPRAPPPLAEDVRMPLLAPAPSRRRTASLLGLVVVALAATGLAVPVSASAAPVPEAPKFRAVIDPYGTWEPETTCNATEKPGTAALRRLVDATYGWIASNIVRSCSSSDSGHEEGRSLDWMTNARDADQLETANTFLEWLRATDEHGNRHAMARRLGIMYVIWNNKMWRAYDANRTDPDGNFTGGWTTYSTTVDGKRTPCTKLPSASYDNTCHRNHVHFSLTWDGAMGRTSYYAHGNPSTICATPPSPGWAPSVTTSSLDFVPLSPRRLVNTRSGTGVVNACRVGAERQIDVQVTGVGGVPQYGVAAVALNVRASRATETTTVSAFPAGTAWPRTASVAVSAGQTRSGLVIVPVGASGRVSLRNFAGAAYLLADVVGYYPTSGEGSSYVASDPTRVLDTRDGSPLPAAAARRVRVAGDGTGIPAGASRVLLNVTALRPEASGTLAVTATPPSRAPRRPKLTYGADRTAANRVIARVATDGTVALWSSARTDAVVDVVGWYGADGARFVPLPGKRLLDTRTTATADTLTGPGAVVTVPVAGRAGVPRDARSVVITLGAVDASASTALTAYPGGGEARGTTDVSVTEGDLRASNLAVVPLGADGSVAVRSRAGTVDATVDVVGFHR